jgi:hypothetical protein
MGREFKIENGSMVSFWMDSWLDNIPLCESYPMLFELSMDQKCFVQVVKGNRWVVRFRNNLHGVLRAQRYGMTEKLNRVTLFEENDKVVWKWSPSKVFSVKSVYEQIKTFMRLVEQKAILTKENMIKRQ